MNQEHSGVKPEIIEGWERDLVRNAERLRQEIEERSSELARIEEQILLLRRFLDLSGAVDDRVRPAEVAIAKWEERDAAERRMEVEDAVQQLLLKRKEPMHISEIREELLATSTPIPGRGDEANIIVRLRKYPDRFTRTARGTYALAAWGLPELETSVRKAPRKKRRA